MKGYIKVAAGTPKIKVAAVTENMTAIMSLIKQADDNSVKILALPKNCLTSDSLGDLAFSGVLQDGVIDALNKIADYTLGRDMLVFLGAPLCVNSQVYSCMVAMCDGAILAAQTLTKCERTQINIGKFSIVAGSAIFFKDVKSGVTVGRHGSNISVVCSADKELMGTQSARLVGLESNSRQYQCGIIFASAGEGESDTDSVCGGARIIAECGDIVEASDLLTTGLLVTELDLGRIKLCQAKNDILSELVGCEQIDFKIDSIECYTISRTIPMYPFLPLKDTLEQYELCFKIQSGALASRMQHVKADTLVLGVSGGLDSSLALLVCMRACDKVGKDYSHIVAVTMPGFGTGEESLARAHALIDLIGATKKVVDIKAGVAAHLKEIGHKKKTDTTYENAQARYRTMSLMDIANSLNGLVVGTGDMSELALGWCTYGGDQISNYNVNSGVPKTLVIELVKYEAQRLGGKIGEQLNKVLSARISPELLPAQDGKAQDTEDILGDYRLHDFFLYYYTMCGAAPQKLLTMAARAFGDEYDPNTIIEQMKLFFSRYFANQFKRSCSPDGVMVCPVSLSPRDGLKMPSDVDMQLWNEQLDKIIKQIKK